MLESVRKTGEAYIINSLIIKTSLIRSDFRLRKSRCDEIIYLARMGQTKSED